MKVIITFTFCCDNLWKSKFMALEKPGKLRDFFCYYGHWSSCSIVCIVCVCVSWLMLLAEFKCQQQWTSVQGYSFALWTSTEWKHPSCHCRLRQRVCFSVTALLFAAHFHCILNIQYCVLHVSVRRLEPVSTLMSAFKYTLSVIANRCLNDTAPQYLASHCVLVSVAASWQHLCSTGRW